MSLVTVFASAALAIDETTDECEFTTLDNDVEVEFPGDVSKVECDHVDHSAKLAHSVW